MQDVNTPMMRQYQEIRKRYPDCLLFYRMGDFYELFMEDAHIGARVLDITLTGKSNGKSGRIPMAGVPYHAVDSYLSKLVKAGYKVAICEQLSEPSKKGLVERDVVRVVTPGTVLDEKSLDKKSHNYVIAIEIVENCLAIAACDLSTGHFQVSEIEFENLHQTVLDELARLSAAECILSPELYNDASLLKVLSSHKTLTIYCYHEWEIYASKAKAYLKKHFKVGTLAGFGIHNKEFAQEVSAVLLSYLASTQKDKVGHITNLSLVGNDNFLQLDRATIINLELFSTIREHDVRGSLLYVLDETVTAMGGRMLKEWMKKPLGQKTEIEKRHSAVEELLKNSTLRNTLREYLTFIADIERVVSRLSVGIGNARDLVNLKQSLKSVVSMRHLLSHTESDLLKEVYKDIPNSIGTIIHEIENIFVDEPPIDVKGGGMVRPGIHKELDTLRGKVNKSTEFLIKLEAEEREKTGISNIKVRYNKVFGFYIEVTKGNARHVPEHYIRKQTLVNAERFITADLKIQEEIILSAEEKINDIEFELFTLTTETVLKQIVALQSASYAIATLDCLASFAHLSEKNHYVRPKLLYSGEVRIKQGRHPVVEKLLEDTQFVPNDVTLDNISQQLLLITGPNMAGKSVFIRQVAVIVLMSQMGCFVPAQSAHLSVMDRIFVRSGASDVITSGMSTFMVEMVETAHILNYATKNSLIIMDEIGRGTSTYDGISIAWAVAEYLATHFKTPPKTLFATHYHELQALENHYPKKIRNFHMAVADDQGDPVFLHTILPGGASHSFGVAVAKLAGIPKEVIEKAQEILQGLESRNVDNQKVITPQLVISNNVRDPKRKKENEISHFIRNDTEAIADHLIHKELENLDISAITPLQALNTLADLKEKIKLFKKENTKNLD